jgi:hypothetical protein
VTPLLLAAVLSGLVVDHSGARIAGACELPAVTVPATGAVALPPVTLAVEPSVPCCGLALAPPVLKRTPARGG